MVRAAAGIPKFVVALATLVSVEPAFAAHCPPGQLWRVRLNECVSLGSPLARPYIGRRKSGATIPAIHASKLKATAAMAPVLAFQEEEDSNTAPTVDPPPTIQAPAAKTPDHPPDEVDMAAWLLLPLLRTVEARWADLVKPPALREPDGQGVRPWPSEGVFGPEF